MSRPDLVDQFFKRDLNPVEEGDLEEMLASSEDAADAFRQKAEAAYRRYGLPRPSGPGVGVSPGTAVFSKWIFLLAVGTAFLGGLWLGFRGYETLVPLKQKEQLSAVTSPVSGPGQERVGKSVFKKPGYSGTKGEGPSLASPTSLSASLSFPREEAPPLISSQIFLGVPTPVSAPSQEGGREGAPEIPGPPELFLVVHTNSTGPVIVRVLNADKKEVRILYSGVLASGQWVFKWDRRLMDGKEAPPGRYYFQGQSKNVTQESKLSLGK